MQEINDSLVAIKRDEDKYQKTIKQLKLSEKNYNLAKRQYKKDTFHILIFTSTRNNACSPKTCCKSKNG